ncbi:putative plastid-lipid-associated protein 11, chloroplastic [Glycine soja]|uniref:Putative plastid-lipid-associated protein 11, chloroplastic n=1 Tax=Glycine soja TaxID=3848 RepID=A0A445M040_GLYSO|nr:putative plastid-lipid-associated protein 11, chloroplastic [Glycine soja]
MLMASAKLLLPYPFTTKLPGPRYSHRRFTCSSVIAQSGSAKEHLLALIADQDRGIRTQSDPAKRAAIVQAIDAVASAGAGSVTTGDALSATWRLLWTTEKEQLFIIEKAPLFGTRAGDVLQVIDVRERTLNNVISFPPDGVFFVRSSIEVASPQRVNFSPSNFPFPSLPSPPLQISKPKRFSTNVISSLRSDFIFQLGKSDLPLSAQAITSSPLLSTLACPDLLGVSNDASGYQLVSMNLHLLFLDWYHLVQLACLHDPSPFVAAVLNLSGDFFPSAIYQDGTLQGFVQHNHHAHRNSFISLSSLVCPRTSNPIAEFLVLLHQLVSEPVPSLVIKQWQRTHTIKLPFVKWKNVSTAECNQDLSSSLLPCNKQYTECFNRGNKILQPQAIHLEVDNTPDEFKVRLAVVHFKGKALQWHSAYIKSVGLENLPSWNEYQILLLDRFGDVCEDPMADLMKLRQTGSIRVS